MFAKGIIKKNEPKDDGLKMTLAPHSKLRKLFDHCLASLVELMDHSFEGKVVDNILE